MLHMDTLNTGAGKVVKMDCGQAVCQENSSTLFQGLGQPELAGGSKTSEGNEDE